MRIIKPGRPPAQIAIKCPVCGCEFEFGPSEATIITSNTVKDCVIACPYDECKTRIFFTASYRDDNTIAIIIKGY